MTAYEEGYEWGWKVLRRTNNEFNPRLGFVEAARCGELAEFKHGFLDALDEAAE